MCEGALTEKECLEALKDMGTEKTPGTDSLPAEFYKVFWKDISFYKNFFSSKSTRYDQNDTTFFLNVLSTNSVIQGYNADLISF